MGVDDGIDVRPGVVYRRVNHGLARRIVDLGYRAFVAGLGVVCLADLEVLIDVDFDNMLRRHVTERRQHGFDKKLSRTGNARADMTMIIGQTLVEHNAVAQRNFLF